MSRTAWLIEGLLQYLEASDVGKLFAGVDALSARGSVLLYDIVGKTMLEAEFLQPTLDYMAKLGAPWTFGSDTPAALVENRGWTATVTDAAEPGNRWNRWMHPPVPAECPGCRAAISSRRSRPRRLTAPRGQFFFNSSASITMMPLGPHANCMTHWVSARSATPGDTPPLH